MTQVGLGLDDGGPDRARLAEFQADFTPAGVVRQGLEALLTAGGSLDRMLDPSAGAGVFGMVAREFDPHGLAEMSWAVEPRFEEKGNLKRWYSEVDCSTYQEAMAGPDAFDGEPFTAIVTNPPFTEFVGLVEASLPLLAPGGHLMLLGLTSVMQRAAEKVAFCIENPPALELRIAGSVKFRNGANPKTGKPYTADMRSYSWWVWKTEFEQLPRRGWTTYQLPMLPPRERSWTVKPGTEPGPAW